MRVWLVQTWEPNPLDPPGSRPWRNWMLADRLIAEGHEVVWWCSNFSHNLKQMRREKPGLYPVRPGFDMVVMDALGYSKHVSWQRIKDHRHVAASFRIQAPNHPRPDVIVAKYPPIEVNHEAVRFANAQGIPVMVDICDQYPDLYWENAPRLIRPAIRAASKVVGFQRLARDTFKGATVITGNGTEVVDWGLQYAGRVRCEQDCSVPISYDPVLTTSEEDALSEAYWRDQKIPEGAMIVLYTGMLGQTIDFDTLLAAMLSLSDDARFFFVFCGAGDNLETYRSQTRGLQNVLFTGWLKAPEIQWIQRRAHWGLIPYKPRANFERGITNKPVEYLAQGLPLLMTLRSGELAKTVQAAGAGRTYRNQHPEDLVNILREAAENPAAFTQMKAAARPTFDHNYHPDLVYGRWIKAISALADRKA